MNRQRAAHRIPSFTLRSAAAVGLAVLFAGTALPAVAKEAAKPAEKAAAKATAKSAPAKGTAAKSTAAKSAATKPGACYSRAEHAAEQTIRMHTEMMVVGLTCQQVNPDKKPFNLYQDFTVKNRSLISNSEASMIDHFRKKGGGNATRQFDMFRTELANEVSRRAAVIGTGLYCANFVDRSKAAMDLTADDIRVLTGDEKSAGLMHLSSKPLCDVQVVSNPDVNYDVAQAPASRSGGAAAASKSTGKATAKAPGKPKEPAKAQVVSAKR
ncbi:hypothetical protein GBZ26_18150 [Azospirillum formosense]|uniref:Uncharacterized protein n=1 Tax=Azospirillum formosense TaxID=861533 RepID=A0ABX2KX07_9PROT|nr:hypothetical protein [Azospirillum formosense]MBY3752973.1 hypothetical protein [Azospirillum formosense]NUB21111.1 hypothetical protein [Azospirillum formosense]